MKPRPFRRLIPAILLLIGVSFALPCCAERGFVLVQVQDTKQHPLRGVEIGIDGFGSSKMTGDDGKAKLSVGSATREGDWLSLTILHSPPGKDLAMISPWDYRVLVPSFEDKPENFVRVVVVRRGDRAALEDSRVLVSLAEKINKANFPKSADKSTPVRDPKENLVAVAKQYGLDPDDVDQTIRAWSAKTTDLNEQGHAALYERNFSRASDLFQDSLKQQEEKLAADQKTVTENQKQVADTLFFLGSSLFQQGKYRETVQAFERCLQILPDDPMVLNNTALSLEYEGDYAAAEPLYRRVLVIDEKAKGPYHLDVAIDLNNLAGVLRDKGDHAGAEPLFRQALAIQEKALGRDHPSDAAKTQAVLVAPQKASDTAITVADAQQNLHQSVSDKVAMRAQLAEQLNKILETRDSARGLIVSMSDVLFDTGKYSLKHGAREKLAKVAGILIAYPGLNIEVGGYTDNVGGDDMNQKLSENRAGAVRDYLVEQGVTTNSVSAKGYGNTPPAASNDNSAGRQVNRRVELVVSGDAIGNGAPDMPGSNQ